MSSLQLFTKIDIFLTKHLPLTTELLVRSVLEIENWKKFLALICFGFDELNMRNLKSCETFDGASVVLMTSLTNWTHDEGGLGLYEGQPTTIGCGYEAHNKIETLSISGWTTLPDFHL